MKKLSDYKDEEAIVLWADILEDMVEILSDNEVATVFRDKSMPTIKRAMVVLKNHAKTTVKILKRIDDTEIDGINLIIRVVDFINEIEEHEELKAFF